MRDTVQRGVQVSQLKERGTAYDYNRASLSSSVSPTNKPEEKSSIRTANRVTPRNENLSGWSFADSDRVLEIGHWTQSQSGQRNVFFIFIILMFNRCQKQISILDIQF